jgi:very-short-patch-repair endonuclease
VTIRRGGSRHRPGITVHTTRSLDAADISVSEGIPCTGPARTLVDLAGVVSPRVLGRAVEQSLVLRLFDRAALDSALAQARGRRGTGTLRRLLASLAEEPPHTRSELERRFVELVRDAGLPVPAANSLVAGYEVDFHWPAERLIVETDGRATHGTHYGFERDRARDLELELAGWHVVRVTWHQVVHEPARVAALLRSRLRPAPRRAT